MAQSRMTFWKNILRVEHTSIRPNPACGLLLISLNSVLKKCRNGTLFLFQDTIFARQVRRQLKNWHLPWQTELPMSSLPLIKGLISTHSGNAWVSSLTAITIFSRKFPNSGQPDVCGRKLCKNALVQQRKKPWCVDFTHRLLALHYRHSRSIIM